MFRYSTLILLFALPLFAPAQTARQASAVDKSKHRVVIQLTSSDTLVHRALVKQIRNVQAAAPNTAIEVVCHNNGIDFLQISRTKCSADIEQLKKSGVDFVACENTMQTRQLKREDLLSACRLVPAGVVEIIVKQEKGWAYIKAGF
ncbi:MAG: DsrE family protein [Saprospirales bacterium]|nr:DsrE family protein [Saprospirales bacterium]MBK8922881.1 DsrE family protein [Saprospirales bacterium]